MRLFSSSHYILQFPSFPADVSPPPLPAQCRLGSVVLFWRFAPAERLISYLRTSEIGVGASWHPSVCLVISLSHTRFSFPPFFLLFVLCLIFVLPVWSSLLNLVWDTVLLRALRKHNLIDVYLMHLRQAVLLNSQSAFKPWACLQGLHAVCTKDVKHRSPETKA